jgi:hypothetical protein
VVDHLRYRSFREGIHEFHGGQRAFDSDAFFNRRAECWSKMAEWLKAGAEIPDDPELDVDLCHLQYGYSPKQQIQLEKKVLTSFLFSELRPPARGGQGVRASEARSLRAFSRIPQEVTFEGRLSWDQS